MAKNFLKFFSSRNRDLTQGPILKNIVYLAFPLMVSFALNTTQSLIDMFWVGRLGSEAIAAVAMSGTIIMVVVTLFFGISTGTVSLISQNFGAGNLKEVENVAMQSLIVSIIVSLIITIIGFVLSEGLLSLIGASQEVILIGTPYLKIIFLGSATMFLLFIGNAILQGVGDTFIPMVLIILANLLNIILDPIFIFGIGVPRMNTNGAAWATVISQAISCLIIFYLFFNGHSKVHIRIKEFKIDFKIIWQIFKIGVPSSLQMFFRSVMGLAMVGLVASFGTYAVAAYGIGMRLQMVTLMPAFALGAAAATLLGQNLGAGKISRAKDSALIATFLDLIIMLLVGLLFFIFSHEMISFFDKTKTVVAIGSEYLRITAIFYSFIAFGVVLNRALGGAGDTFVPMLITFVSLWLIQIPLAIILAKNSFFGLKGIWWSISIASVINGVLTLLWFIIGKWQKRSLTAVVS
ncbi:MAG: MATE family efflux transporter [Candidatus Omnitrophota bacterium]|nr:MATE family efflux transporter [Candidatus Omnitrophota bacterium]